MTSLLFPALPREINLAIIDYFDKPSKWNCLHVNHGVRELAAESFAKDYPDTSKDEQIPLAQRVAMQYAMEKNFSALKNNKAFYLHSFQIPHINAQKFDVFGNMSVSTGATDRRRDWICLFNEKTKKSLTAQISAKVQCVKIINDKLMLFSTSNQFLFRVKISETGIFSANGSQVDFPIDKIEYCEELKTALLLKRGQKVEKYICDLETFDHKHTFKGYPFQFIQLTKDRLICASIKDIFVHSSTTNEVQKTIKPEGYIYSLKLKRNLLSVAICKGPSIHVYDLDKIDAPPLVIKVSNIAFNLEAWNKQILFLDHGGKISIWNIETAKMLNQIWISKRSGPLRAMRFANGGLYLLESKQNAIPRKFSFDSQAKIPLNMLDALDFANQHSHLGALPKAEVKKIYTEARRLKNPLMEYGRSPQQAGMLTYYGDIRLPPEEQCSAEDRNKIIEMRKEEWKKKIARNQKKE